MEQAKLLGATVRMWYNPATMQTEVRYIVYDESEAYLRYQAYIAWLEPGADKPSFAEFVDALQSGGGDPDSKQDELFDKVNRWYGTDPAVEVNELRNAYEAALEDARAARPDIAWPENLGDCTLEQMIILESYL